MGKPESLITFVTDRPGHDRRYAIDSTKVEKEKNIVDELYDLGGIEYVNIVMQNDEVSN